jgi:hypothetical protein
MLALSCDTNAANVRATPGHKNNHTDQYASMARISANKTPQRVPQFTALTGQISHGVAQKVVLAQDAPVLESALAELVITRIADVSSSAN